MYGMPGVWQDCVHMWQIKSESAFTPHWPKHIQRDWVCPYTDHSNGLKKEHPSVSCLSWSWPPGAWIMAESREMPLISEISNKRDSERRGWIKVNTDDWVGTHGCLFGTAESGGNTCLPNDKHVNAPIWNIWSEQRSDVIWRDSWSHVPCDDVHPFKRQKRGMLHYTEAPCFIGWKRT